MDGNRHFQHIGRDECLQTIGVQHTTQDVIVFSMVMTYQTLQRRSLQTASVGGESNNSRCRSRSSHSGVSVMMTTLTVMTVFMTMIMTVTPTVVPTGVVVAVVVALTGAVVMMSAAVVDTPVAVVISIIRTVTMFKLSMVGVGMTMVIILVRIHGGGLMHTRCECTLLVTVSSGTGNHTLIRHLNTGGGGLLALLFFFRII